LAISQKERADWTVGVVAGLDEFGDLWLVDLYRGHWDAADIADNLLACWEKYKPDLLGVEEGQIKLALGPYLERAAEERGMWDFSVEPLKPGRRDKVARARSLQGLMRRRKVKFPKKAVWVGDLVKEMMQFPNGEHDDMVDAAAYLALMLQDMAYIRPPQGEKEQSSPLPGERPWRERLRELLGGSVLGDKDWRSA
jgi:predicted phage terminase large subunit-like protein